MCFRIVRCCGWILDFLQRFLTFILACILCCALCIGFIVVLSAGIAYGYNISVAEFLDLKRADITVYVRRGQFGDKPTLQVPLRRTGGDEPDLFASNFSVDYQDQKLIDNARPLSDAWQKAQDTSNYADKLTKYSRMKSNIMRAFPKGEDDGGDLPLEEPSTEGNVPSFVKSVQFITDGTSLTSERPKMRNFLPDYRPTYSQDDDINQEIQETQRSNRRNKHKKKMPDVRIEADDSKSLYLQPNASKFLYRQEDFEDGDVETIYKSV